MILKNAMSNYTGIRRNYDEKGFKKIVNSIILSCCCSFHKSGGSNYLEKHRLRKILTSTLKLQRLKELIW